jgi:hypothetical protein
MPDNEGPRFGEMLVWPMALLLQLALADVVIGSHDDAPAFP